MTDTTENLARCAYCGAVEGNEVGPLPRVCTVEIFKIPDLGTICDECLEDIETMTDERYEPTNKHMLSGWEALNERGYD